jgi:hypothetical protein
VPRLVDEHDVEMTRLGVDTLRPVPSGPPLLPSRHTTSPAVRRFLFSELMTDVARAALGDNLYLFNEQYVIKAAEQGIPFSWHQDSGFIPYPHRRYLTCWIPLDDVTESNGTVHLLPYSRAGTRDVVEHHRDHHTNDLIGYSGPDPGDPLILPAGSIVAFSNTLLPRTGPNTSDQPRHVYIAQYTAEPLLSEDRSRPRHLRRLGIAGNAAASWTMSKRSSTLPSISLITQQTCVCDTQSIPATAPITTLLASACWMSRLSGVDTGCSVQGARSAWPYRQSSTPEPASPAALPLALNGASIASSVPAVYRWLGTSLVHRDAQ